MHQRIVWANHVADLESASRRPGRTGQTELSPSLPRPPCVSLLLSCRPLLIAFSTEDGSARRERKERQFLNVLSAGSTFQIERSYIVHTPSFCCFKIARRDSSHGGYTITIPGPRKRHKEAACRDCCSVVIRMQNIRGSKQRPPPARPYPQRNPRMKNVSL